MLRRLRAWFGGRDGVSEAWLRGQARHDMKEAAPQLPRWRSPQEIAEMHQRDRWLAISVRVTEQRRRRRA